LDTETICIPGYQIDSPSTGSLVNFPTKVCANGQIVFEMRVELL